MSTTETAEMPKDQPNKAEEEPAKEPRPGMPPKQMSNVSNKSAKELARQRPSRLSMEGYIYNANTVLEEALNPMTRDVPTELVEKCKGIAILNIVHVGALMTMYYGTGLVMAKNVESTDNNKWSAPSSVLIDGFSMGAVLGGKNDSVLVFIMDDATMKDFATKPQSRMGLNAAIAVGKKGGAKNIGIDQGTVSMTFTHGAFAGVSLQVGTLVHQERQNEVFYGKKISPEKILLEKAVKPAANTQVPDIYKKLDMLELGDTWVPSAEDMERSSRFLESAHSTSMKFNSEQLANASE